MSRHEFSAHPVEAERQAASSTSVRGVGDVGIIGCGAVTRATIGDLTDAGGRIEWVADPDREARASLIHELSGLQVAVPLEFDDVGEALRRGSSETSVIVNSPATLHLPHIEQCARAGRPMLVAKPLATSIVDAERALDIAAAHDVSLAVAEQYPYEPHALTVGDLIERQGPVRRIHFDHRKPASSQSTLAGKDQTGILEFAVHHYAVLDSWLEQVPEAVSADTWSAGPAANGNGSSGHGWIRYDGCHVTHAFGFGSPRPVYRLEIENELGDAVAEGSHFCDPEAVLQVTRGEQLVPERPRRPRAWEALFQGWFASPAFETPAAQRRRMLVVTAMADAAIRSASEGRVIAFDADPRYRNVT